MPEDIISIITQGGSTASADSKGVTTKGESKKPSTTQTNSVLDEVAKRLTKQGQGISSSSSSDLQSEIKKAMAGIASAGESTAERLQSERGREVGFARDRASATYTTALEERTGYATQVAGLRELTETTEKSVRDLDSRYQEALLANDANTASQIAGLRMQKLQFQIEQEQNFFNNLLSLGNLQEQSLSRQQQNEQFWIEKEARDKQFVVEMATSNYQFEKNYGISLQEMDLKEQQLEIERSRYNLSLREYNDRKKELTEEKSRAYTKAIVSNDIKNNIIGPDGKLRSRSQMLTPNFMLKMKEETDFDGTTEELAELVSEAYDDMSNDKSFISQFIPNPGKPIFTSDRNINKKIVEQSNAAKVIYDRERGVTIQSPESFWANLLN